MKSHIRPTLAVLCCAALSACESSTAMPHVSRLDSAGIQIVNADLGQLVAQCTVTPEPSMNIGNVEGTPGQDLYRVFGATRMSDGRIAVVNQGSQELRFYNPEGEFLSASGGEGEGPGEFMNAFLLLTPGADTLWVGDYRPWNWEVFTPAGEWVRAIRPEPAMANPPRELAVLAGGRMFLGNADAFDRRANFRADSLHLMQYDRDGVLIDTFAVLPYGRWGQTSDDRTSVWMQPWFESTTELGGRGNVLALGHSSLAELKLFRVGDRPELERILRWDAGDRTVRDSDVEAAISAMVERYVDIDAAMRARLVDPLIDPARPVADVFPSMVSVYFGTDDSIWVKEYPRPNGDDLAHWIRFSADGTPVCRMQVTRDLQIYEFGPDYVLGKIADELGVEHVVMHEMRATTPES